MQVNSVAPITLIYPTTKSRQIFIYDKYDFKEIKQLYFANGLKAEKPNAFKWPDAHLRPVTPKLINWLQTDFKPLFQYDPFMWMASEVAVGPKFQPILKELFNEQSTS